MANETHIDVKMGADTRELDKSLERSAKKYAKVLGGPGGRFSGGTSIEKELAQLDKLELNYRKAKLAETQRKWKDAQREDAVEARQKRTRQRDEDRAARIRQREERIRARNVAQQERAARTMGVAQAAAGGYDAMRTRQMGVMQGSAQAMDARRQYAMRDIYDTATRQTSGFRGRGALDPQNWRRAAFGVAGVGMAAGGFLGAQLMGGTREAWDYFQQHRQAIWGTMGTGGATPAMVKKLADAPGPASAGAMGYGPTEIAKLIPAMSHATGQQDPTAMMRAMTARNMSSGQVGGIFSQIRNGGFGFSAGGGGAGVKQYEQILGGAVEAGINKSEMGRFGEFADAITKIMRNQERYSVGNVSAGDAVRGATRMSRTGLSGFQGRRGAAKSLSYSEGIRASSGEFGDALKLQAFGAQEFGELYARERMARAGEPEKNSLEKFLLSSFGIEGAIHQLVFLTGMTPGEALERLTKAQITSGRAPSLSLKKEAAKQGSLYAKGKYDPRIKTNRQRSMLKTGERLQPSVDPVLQTKAEAVDWTWGKINDFLEATGIREKEGDRVRRVTGPLVPKTETVTNEKGPDFIPREYKVSTGKASRMYQELLEHSMGTASVLRRQMARRGGKGVPDPVVMTNYIENKVRTDIAAEFAAGRINRQQFDQATQRVDAAMRYVDPTEGVMKSTRALRDSGDPAAADAVMKQLDNAAKLLKTQQLQQSNLTE